MKFLENGIVGIFREEIKTESETSQISQQPFHTLRQEYERNGGFLSTWIVILTNTNILKQLLSCTKPLAKTCFNDELAEFFSDYSLVLEEGVSDPIVNPVVETTLGKMFGKTYNKFPRCVGHPGCYIATHLDILIDLTEYALSDVSFESKCESKFLRELIPKAQIGKYRKIIHLFELRAGMKGCFEPYYEMVKLVLENNFPFSYKCFENTIIDMFGSCFKSHPCFSQREMKFIHDLSFTAYSMLMDSTTGLLPNLQKKYPDLVNQLKIFFFN